MKLAIIGFGPRGLYSLESLIAIAVSKNKLTDLKITIFEPNKDLGVGKAWELNQPDSNWINISDFALQGLKGRVKVKSDSAEIPDFLSYSSWCLENDFEINEDKNKDIYPSRSQMGKYLNERAISITKPLIVAGILKVSQEKVLELNYTLRKVDVVTNNISSETFDECLLTIGHQTTELSEEETKNSKHANTNTCTYIHSPYENNISEEISSSQNVAIIGFGLTMIDITRMLISNLEGSFKKMNNSYLLKFESENKSDLKIIPYSFDGLPCVPKPYGREVDNKFKPSKIEENKFELEIGNALSDGASISSPYFLLKAFAKVAASIFIENQEGDGKTNIVVQEIEKLIIEWLKDPELEHKLFLDKKQNKREYMVACVEMALGLRSFSLDFTIGQAWRHLQPVMYRLFAFSSITDDVMKQIIDIDEGTKRYSYGPPVESIIQLISLNDSGILELNYVNDPEINLHDNGWELSKNDTTIVCATLINSVLDAPNISKINSDIIKGLRNQNLVTEVIEGLGAKTHPNGILINDKLSETPIAIIGRNAKGNVLGTDAILECFNEEITDWANGVIERM